MIHAISWLKYRFYVMYEKKVSNQINLSQWFSNFSVLDKLVHFRRLDVEAASHSSESLKVKTSHPYV